jgi:hypothetical protein
MEGATIPAAGTPASDSAIPKEIAKAVALREPLSLFPASSALGRLGAIVGVVFTAALAKFWNDPVGLAILFGCLALLALYVAFTAVRRLDLDTTALTLVPLLACRPEQSIPITAIGAFGVVPYAWAQRWNFRRYGTTPPPILRATLAPGAFKLFGIWPQKSLTIGMLYAPAPRLPVLTADQFIALVDAYREAPLGTAPPWYPLGRTRLRRALVHIALFLGLLIVLTLIALFQTGVL